MPSRPPKTADCRPAPSGFIGLLKDNEALAKAGVSGVELAKEAETLLTRFTNAPVNDDERRRLRAALYRPLLGVDKQNRGRFVEAVLAILLDGGSDDASA